MKTFLTLSEPGKKIVNTYFYWETYIRRTYFFCCELQARTIWVCYKYRRKFTSNILPRLLDSTREVWKYYNMRKHSNNKFNIMHRKTMNRRIFIHFVYYYCSSVFALNFLDLNLNNNQNRYHNTYCFQHFENFYGLKK